MSPHCARPLVVLPIPIPTKQGSEELLTAAVERGSFTSRNFSLKGSGQGCPLLRASNEHFLNVRVLRARRAPGRSLLILLRARVARVQGAHVAIRPLLADFISSLLGKKPSAKAYGVFAQRNP
jgi:hypothetical protein